MITRIPPSPSSWPLLLCRLAMLLVLSSSFAVSGGEAPATGARENAAARGPGLPSAESIASDLGYSKPGKAVLLCFVARGDSRPWYVDDALILYTPSSNRWMVAHAVRNPAVPVPKEKRTTRPTTWTLHELMDAPPCGDATFARCPTLAEMEAFLKRTDWPLAEDRQWRIRSAHVPVATWQKSLGYGPPPSIRALTTSAKETPGH